MKRKILMTISALLLSFNSYSLDRYEISNLVDQLQPAVVKITGMAKQTNTDSSYSYNPFSNKKLNNSDKHIVTETSFASGVIISSDGYVITNNHAVAVSDMVKIQVEGKTYDAKVVGVDKDTDLALLKIGTYDAFKYVTLANSDKVRVGELVFAIGNPYGLENSVSSGIISGVHRTIGAAEYEDFLQTDASINPGNSGGPLFNLDGHMIGINTAKHIGAEGIGFAIPSNLVQRIINQLKDNGSVKRGWFGVKAIDIDDYTQTKLGLNNKDGVLIYDIVANSSASRAGLIPGDVIIKYDYNKINTLTDLRELMENTKINSTVNLGIKRNNKLMTFKVKFIEENTVYASR